MLDQAIQAIVQGIFKDADPETIDLLKRFYMRAASTGNVNGFLKKTLRAALEDGPERRVIEVVDAKPLRR